jgi:hypothetical protein
MELIRRFRRKAQILMQSGNYGECMWSQFRKRQKASKPVHEIFWLHGTKRLGWRRSQRHACFQSGPYRSWVSFTMEGLKRNVAQKQNRTGGEKTEGFDTNWRESTRIFTKENKGNEGRKTEFHYNQLELQRQFMLTPAIYTMNYNFCRIHQTLRVTPAMEAGVSDHVWSLEEIVNLLA